MADARDILELERPPSPKLKKETFLGSDKQKKIFTPLVTRQQRRPEGMTRELFNLLCDDNKVVPVLSAPGTVEGYKSTKAKMGIRKVRPWAWQPFKNPARTDNAAFYRWTRVTDEPGEYFSAQFNKKLEIPGYTDSDYAVHLSCEGWSQEETDHLFDLARRFDLRWPVMADRWDRELFVPRSIEDLKERYYKIQATLASLRGEENPYTYDADHERKRKKQLEILYSRTPEEIEEEKNLMIAMKQIEARKKIRERKTEELQKLINQENEAPAKPRKSDKKLPKKKSTKYSNVDVRPVESTIIKFAGNKSSGVSLRSSSTKLPSNISQKKCEEIDSTLTSLGVELKPIATEEVCSNFNELRSDILLLTELKKALTICDEELQTLQHEYEALCSVNTLSEPANTLSEPVNTVCEPANTLSEPVNTLSEPVNTLSEPANTLSEPANTLSEPANTLSEPANTLSEPANRLSEPANLEDESRGF